MEGLRYDGRFLRFNPKHDVTMNIDFDMNFGNLQRLRYHFGDGPTQTPRTRNHESSYRVSVRDLPSFPTSFNIDFEKLVAFWLGETCPADFVIDDNISSYYVVVEPSGTSLVNIHCTTAEAASIVMRTAYHWFFLRYKKDRSGIVNLRPLPWYCSTWFDVPPGTSRCRIGAALTSTSSGYGW